MRVLTQREPDLDIAGITAAQFLAGGLPLIPLVIVAGGSTDWARPVLLAQLIYLIIGGQLLVYVGFNAALSRWPSTRVYAWTFLVPAVAVVIQALRGALPGVSTMLGIALVILGVAIVNHPRAEAPRADEASPPHNCRSERAPTCAEPRGQTPSSQDGQAPPGNRGPSHYPTLTATDDAAGSASLRAAIGLPLCVAGAEFG